MKRTQRMSFCIRAATTLHSSDLDTLTAAIETYIDNGVPTAKAETLAVADALSQLRAERAEVEQALRDQHSDLFKKAMAADAPPAATSGQPSKFANNKIFTEDAVAAARAVLKRKLGNVNSGLDPELLQAGLTLAGAHIEAGARSFADFTKAMLADLGDAVRPYLKSWYMGMRYDPRAAGFEGMSAAAEVDAADVAALAPVEPAANAADTASKETSDDSTPATDAPALDRPLADGLQNAASVEPVRGAQQPRARTRRSNDPDVRGQGGLFEGATDEVGRVGNGAGNDAVSDRQDDAVAGGGRRVSAPDFRPAAGDLTRTGSWHATATRNVDLIDLALAIEKEGRPATAEEQAKLAKYVGFGASEIRNALFPVPPSYAKAKEPGRLIWPEHVREARWKPLAERLAALPIDWQKSVLQSSQYAHYTSEGIVRSTWSALQRLGFTGGRVLEPGSGIGTFAMLMPPSVHKSSKYTGMEFDGPTALIARLLSPQQNMLHEDFIKRKLPRDYFDLAVGNPPFSQTPILGDSDYEKHGFMLHDFFFAKSIDRVRPGGLLAFVTSKGTMDKQTDKARKYLSDRADLVGAIRLPSTAFEDNAGTSVVTDVIFLRKRLPGETPAGKAWNSLKTVETKDGATPINEYFADHPDMVLGQHRISGNVDDLGRRIDSNGRGGEKYTVVSYDSTPAELDAKFAAAIERLPQNAYSSLSQDATQLRRETAKVDFDPKVKREGVIYVADDGTLMRVENGVGKGLDGSVKLADKERAWFKGYVDIRDAVQMARAAQVEEGDWAGALRRLNKAYDDFRKEHGPINDFRVQVRKSTDEDGNTVETPIRIFKNRRLFREDYDSAIVTQLEAINEAGEVVKAAFLKDRTIGKPVVREVRTVGDALAVSLDQTGSLDLDDIARRGGVTRQEAIDALGNQVYRTPQGAWQLADEYLSGDVRTKLEEAELAARDTPDLARNVEALKEVQPERLGPSQIGVKLGASWVPVEHVNEFATLIEAGEVKFDSLTESWQVDGGNERRGRKAGSEYGTAQRGPSELLEAALNSKSIVIKTKDENKKEITDAEATTAAVEMLKKIKDKFKSWVWTDSDRAASLVDIYNQRFNNIAPRRFDGSYLTLPGVSLRYALHPHQLTAIARQIQTGDTYLAHAVGAGKTIQMIAGGMEQKRLGLIRKPMYTVPNHMLEQFANEFMELYPLANIMVADDENFSAERRKAFVAAATLNAPDAIIITHSAFERIGVKEETVAPIRDALLHDLEMALEEVASDKGKRVRRSQLEQQIEAVTQRFDRIVGAGSKDSTIKFEDIGADYLYVDEAHAFRKLDFTTNQKIKGIDPTGSKRALDMYVKTRFLEKARPGRAMTFASGTPVTNTMGELYTIMRFFAGEELARTGTASFDGWARQYGEAVASLEANAAGRYETVERFAKFDNVPELMSRIRQFMDVLNSEHLGALVKRPDVKGGRPNLITVEATPELKAYMKTVLVPRLKASRRWKPSPAQPFNPDPVIAITSDGRFAALDPRFFGAQVGRDTPTKLSAMGDKIAEIYKASGDNAYLERDGTTSARKGSAQIVFYNLGFGKQSQENRGFNARAALTKRLTDSGVKRTDIAWFDDADTDAKKEAVFKGMRSGELRVLIGSAKKMGTGVNVQNRLLALHYFDPPWFPSDVEQPHGRLIRQGNQNAEGEIHWYATKGTYDSTMWQMVARKQRFIDQAFSGDKSLRSMDDMSEASSYEQAAAVASGDPRALQLAGLRQDVERFERLQAAHANEQVNVRHALRSAEWNVESYEKRAKTYAKAFAALGDRYFAFTDGSIGGKTYTKQGELGDALKAAFNAGAAAFVVDPKKVIRELGTVGPVGLSMEAEFGKKDEPSGEHLLTATIGGVDFPLMRGAQFGAEVDAVGLVRRIVNAANGVDTELRRAREAAIREQTDVTRLSKKMGAPFEYAQDLAEKFSELKSLEAELRAEGEADAREAARVHDQKVAVVNPDGTTDGEAPAAPVASRGTASPEANALKAISENDDLFALPRSRKNTVAGIAADIDPNIKVEQLKADPGKTERYRLTMPDGKTGLLYVRTPNPYGPTLYGFDLNEGEMSSVYEGRPGENPQDVPADKQDVYIDVSALKSGGFGNAVYAIAGTYARNTDRMFIGDPAGLSDAALRRRSEQMLSLALKYGTTEFLAPHPRQEAGAPSLGVQPLKWVYGDDIGNIRRLIDLNVKALDNALPTSKNLDFDVNTGQFLDVSDGGRRVVSRGAADRAGDRAAASGAADSAVAGRRTLERGAVLRALLRDEGGTGKPDGQRDGLLARLAGLASNAPEATRGIFYSRTDASTQGGLTATALRAAIAPIVSAWKNGPKGGVNVVESADKLPDSVLRSVRSSDPDGQARAWFDPATEAVYLIADKLPTVADAQFALFHEVYGHFGMRSLLGATYEAKMMMLRRANPSLAAEASMWFAHYGRQEVAARVGRGMAPLAAEREVRVLSTEEALADRAGMSKPIKAWEKVSANIQQFLRSIGLNAVADWIENHTEAETMAFLAQARDVVRNGKPAAGPSSAPSAAVASRTITLDTVQRLADTKLPAGYVVGDFLNQDGKMHWWHNTVGTPFNLAERSTAFKPVYDGVQNFINDVSLYATEAADMAPKILPKLESWKDIAKSPLSAADTKAIGAPIFEGTLSWGRDEMGRPVSMDELKRRADGLDAEQKANLLMRTGKLTPMVLRMWQGLPIAQFEALVEGKYERDMLKAGVVWKDAELKSMFNLSPGQIALYKEFRGATDRSLTNLALSEMLQLGGADVAGLRDKAIGLSLDEASVLLRDALFERADSDPARKTTLNDTGNKMIDIADRAKDLQARGYAPLSRFGNYTLDVVVEGERKFFSLYESKAERAKMARTMRAEFPTARIEQGTVSQEGFKLFAGVSPETMELFGEMLGLDAAGDTSSSAAFAKFVKLTKSNRSTMQRLLKRKGIAGYSEDAGRVLAGFVYSNARKTSSNLHLKAIDSAVNDIPQGQGELKDAAVRLTDYVKNPREEAQAFRGLLFAQYLGGSVASAMVNMTQPVAVTFPYLSQYGGVGKAAARMTAAAKDALKAKTGDAALDAALKHAEEQGIVAPQEVHQLMAQAQGRATLKAGDGTAAGNAAAKASNALSKLTLAWGKVFGVAEQFNRRITFIAAYRTAIGEGIDNAAEFAAKAIANTQFTYNKGNKPRWARGAVGSVLFTFKSYSVQYLELLHRMATQGGPEGKKAALLAMAVLFLMSGAKGIPFADDLDDLLDGLMQRLGYNFSSKRTKREFFANLLGEEGGRFVEHGLSGLPGVPIDVSGRMGMGNLIPGTGLLTKKADHTSDLTELLGPAGDLAKRAFEGAGQLVDGDVKKALTSIAPTAVRNVVKAADMADTGAYRDQKGRKVIDVDTGDVISKALGFQPNDVARVQEASQLAQSLVGQARMKQSELNAAMAQAIYEKDTDAREAVRAARDRWNEANPESRINISMPSVLKQLQAMKQDKTTRLANAAPKGIRAQVKRELAGANE